MKLKKGMYVMTNDRMEIGRIKGFCTCEMCEKRGFYKPLIDKDIFITVYDKSQGFHNYKFYDNLIDLVEVGDYANGYYISKIWESGEITHYVDKKPIRRKEREITIQAPSYGGIIHLKNKDIKSVVTKEQFNSMKYEVDSNV